MSHRTTFDGIVYDHPSGIRIGIVQPDTVGIILDEDVYRDDDRYADEPAAWPRNTENHLSLHDVAR